MAYTLTCDPFVVITEQDINPQTGIQSRVIYLVPTTGEMWQINGECNQCGECWERATAPAPTLDCPVRPEIKDAFPNCTLSGVYL